MGGRRLANESRVYAQARAQLLEAEIALKEQCERVAALRRALPEGPVVEDYVFSGCDAPVEAPDAQPRPLRLSELFTDPGKPLIVVHFMYGGAQENPCPMCSLWADGYDGVVRHLERRANFAVVAQAELPRLRAWARVRGWSHVRLVSSHGTSFKSDLGMQDEDGSQRPGVSVFTLDGERRVRHFYTGEAMMAPGHFRGMDLLSPVWNFFDLLPEGRGDWMPSLEYEA